ncbi:hypothetical protein ACWEJ6_51295 [Nonomuraea sp. NPDC004702]
MVSIAQPRPRPRERTLDIVSPHFVGEVHGRLGSVDDRIVGHRPQRPPARLKMKIPTHLGILLAGQRAA